MEYIVKFIVKKTVNPYKNNGEYHWVECIDPEALDVLLEFLIGIMELPYGEARELIRDSIVSLREEV